MNTNTTRGLSFGQKILQNANTRLESDEKRHKKGKRHNYDNDLPRSKQRAMRKMVPPGTFGKKILSQAGSSLETGEKRENIPKAERTNWWEARNAGLGRGAVEGLAGGAGGAGVGALVGRTLGRGKGRLGAVLGGLTGVFAGNAHGDLAGHRNNLRQQQASGRNVTKLQNALSYGGLRKSNPNKKYRPGAKSAETDSFGHMVMDQARRGLPQE